MTGADAKKLNLGCGKHILPGWINVDRVLLDGVDLIADLDDCQHTRLPFSDSSIDEFLASHILEHLHHPLPLMEELHRIAKPNAIATIRLPYGSSDDAFGDPTHVRQYFIQSFNYFAQPFYFWADYQYRGDWQTQKITLLVSAQRYEGKTAEQILFEVNSYRNVVQEMIVELQVIKPIRSPDPTSTYSPNIEIRLT